MRRRKNFLFGSQTKYEVNVYHYGKAYARGGRNVNSRKFPNVQAAIQWAKVNLDYPEVEVVDLSTGRVLFSGGTGKVGNPRKKRKPRRRDVYAEIAKSRKTTRGHKRKDRKRAVKRGSSRKPKHKSRYNPEAFEQGSREKEITAIWRAWNSALQKEGVDGRILPNLFNEDVKDQIADGAELLVATQHAELRSDAMEGAKPKAVAVTALGLAPGGVYEEYLSEHGTEHGGVFLPAMKEVENFVKAGRKKVASEVKAGSAKVVSAQAEAKEKARFKALQAEKAQLQADLEEEAMPDDIAGELAEVFDSDQRQFALATDPEDLEYEPEPVGFHSTPTPRSHKRRERLGHYADYLSPVRRRDVQPPMKMLGQTREDVLLYALKDGTTQVWMKGAMTVTFEPSPKVPSYKIAHRYANKWRGLKPSGGVDPDAKKSRLRTAVYLASEGKSTLKQVEKPIALVERKEKKGKRAQHDMPDLDAYELTGDRANPRRRKNGAVVQRLDWEQEQRLLGQPKPKWALYVVSDIHTMLVGLFWKKGDAEMVATGMNEGAARFAKANMKRNGSRNGYYVDEMDKRGVDAWTHDGMWGVTLSKSGYNQPIGYFHEKKDAEFASFWLDRSDYLQDKYPDTPHPRKYRFYHKNAECKVNGCHRKARSKGFCKKHNPRRRKNIMSSAAGSYDYDSYSPRSRRGLNPYAKRYTLTSFSEKYWGKGYREVPRTIRMEFWDDFKYAFKGGLGRYKLETRG